MAESSANSVRWYGLDLIRLLCFFCIVEFHFGLFYFGEPTTGYTDQSIFIWAVDWLGHLLMQSGFIIAFLSTLLLSLNKKSGSKAYRLFGVLTLGWLVLSIQTNSQVWISWDVFGLIFCAIGAALLIEAGVGILGVRIAGCLGYLLLWMPIWELAPYLHPGFETIKHVLGVASCEGQEVAEWPLLPWTGLIWFGYWMGAEVRRIRDSGRLETLRVGRFEVLVWTLILGSSVPQLGAYLYVRMGAYFSCEAYRQAPVIFWSHLVWPLALIRLSFDPRIQSRLARMRWVQTASNLAISRKFWLAYLVQYVFGRVVAYALNTWETLESDSFQLWELPILEFMAISIIFQTELWTRAAEKLLVKISRWMVSRNDHANAIIVSPPSGGGA